MAKTFEVHTHNWVANGKRGEFEHSHVDGNWAQGGHSHPETGPACFTIDKDEWYWATGLKGGGRKIFTAKPKGLQLPIVGAAKVAA